MGAALTYATKQRDKLSQFLHDPKLPLDNNVAERALRIVALGGKSSLFAGSAEHAQNLAIIPIDRRDLPRARGQPIRLHPPHADRGSVAPSSAHRRADALAMAPLRGIAVGPQLPLLFAPPADWRRRFVSVAGASAPRRQTPSEAVP